MAATVAITRRMGGVGGVACNTVTLTGDTSYPTGGYAITANSCGLGSITELIPVGSSSGYEPHWDQANSKLLLFADQSNALLSVSKAVTAATMTDNTDTTGFIDFATGALPVGATPVASQFVVTAGFTGDTTAVWKMGISGDLDRYSAVTTNSCLTAITTSSLVKNATAVQSTDAARTPRLTITGSADFTSIATAAAGAGTAFLYYLLPATSSTTGAAAEVANATNVSSVVTRAMVYGTP